MRCHAPDPLRPVARRTAAWIALAASVSCAPPAARPVGEDAAGEVTRTASPAAVPTARPSAPSPSPAPASASAGASGARSTTSAAAGASGSPSTTSIAPPFATGAVRWVVQPVDNTGTYALATWGDGSLLVAGNNQSNVSSREDMFLERIAGDGARRWYVGGKAKSARAASAAREHAFSVSEVIGQVDLLGVRAHTRDTVAVVTKLDASGALAWGHVHASGSFTRAPGLAATPDGGVVVALELFAPPTSGPLAIPLAGSSDAVLVKHDGAGAVAWVRAFDWPGYDTVAGVASFDGALWAAGTRWKTTNADLQARSEDCHGWVARLDERGVPAWSVDLGGGPGRVDVREVVPARGHGVVVAGSLTGRQRLGAFELDGGSGSRSFYAAVDAAGVVRWARLGDPSACTVADDRGGLLLASAEGVRGLGPGGASIELLRFEPGAVQSLTGCALDGARTLYLGGTLARGATLGGVAPSAPRTQRWKERWAQTSEVGFVARIDLSSAP